MISDIEQMFKNAGVALDKIILTEGVAELKQQYPLISDNDYQQLIRFDPTYKGGNELGKYGRWILDLYNLFVKDRNAEEKYEKAKAYVAEHPDANMPPAPALKSQDRIEDFQKIPDLLKDLETHLNDIKEPIQSFKSVSDLATAVSSAVEKDVPVNEKAEKSWRVFREAMADGLKVVYQDNDWIIGIPETYESSSHFKKPVTNWCTAYPDMYEEYMQDFGGKYYIHLNKKTGALYQLHAESDQFKNRSDQEIDRKKFIARYPKLKEFYGEIISPELPDFWMLHNNRPTGEELIEVIRRNPSAIRYIRNPSERMQHVAVSGDGEAIRYIKDPSHDIRLAAVKNTGYAIEVIKNPTEEEELVAVSRNPSVLRLIKQPTAEVRKEAVKREGSTLEFISNPTKEERSLALRSDGKAICFIKNPTEVEQMTAVSSDGLSLIYIKTPTQAVRLTAIKNYPHVIEFIHSPTEEEQLLAVSLDESAIKRIKDPTEKVQMVAVKQSPGCIRFIKNPTEKVQLEAVKAGRWLYNYISNPTQKVKELYHELYG